MASADMAPGVGTDAVPTVDRPLLQVWRFSRRALATDAAPATAGVSVGAGAGADVAARNLVTRAATVALTMRHGAYALATAVALAVPDAIATTTGRVCAGSLLVWSVFRLLSRRHRLSFEAVDAAFVVLFALGLPWFTADSLFHTGNGLAIAVIGTSITTTALIHPARLSFPYTALVVSCYVAGSVRVIGWPGTPANFYLYYSWFQWSIAAAIRRSALKVSAAVDVAHAQTAAAAVGDDVAAALRDSEAEHHALLHDTAASTLLLVGGGVDVGADRLRAQARRDLDVLTRNSPGGERDLLAALRDAMIGSVPARLTGEASLRLPAGVVHRVVSAVQEALANVERHARASEVSIDVGTTRVRVRDDGVGFDAGSVASGYGIRHCIGERMRRIGGRAEVASRPGDGTTVDLYLPVATPPTSTAAASLAAAERLAEGLRLGYGRAIVVLAVINIVTTAGIALRGIDGAPVQLLLAAATAVATLGALPDIRADRPWSPLATVSVTVIVAIVLVQPLTLPGASVNGEGNWGQGAAGWCLIPFLLRLPVGVGVAAMTAVWAAMALIKLSREFSEATLLNLGLGTASIFVVQLFGLLFSAMQRESATASAAETQQFWRSERRRRIERATAEEHRQRTQALSAGVVPVLERIADGAPIDPPLRRRALTESHRLRALFDNAASFDHPLLRALRPAIDAATARGVAVTVHVDPLAPPPAERHRRVFADAMSAALAVAGDSARLVVGADGGRVSASIVCDTTEDVTAAPWVPAPGAGAAGPGEGADIEILATADGGVLWLTLSAEQVPLPA